MLPLTTPSMPMTSSMRQPLDLGPSALPLRASAPAGQTPPPAAAGMIGGGAPMNSLPSPSAPATPPWNVILQDDGSSIYQIPSPQPGGKPVVIGVNKSPKLPAALQPPKQAAA